VNFASGKALQKEAKSALGAIYAIVGSAGSWHNHLALAWVRRRGFAPFAIYRIVVGTAVLAWAMAYLK